MPRMSGSGRPDEQFAVGDVFGRERDRHREDARTDARLSGGHPERRAAANREELGLGDRQVVEEETRRLAPHHAEIGKVGRRVADQKVVDVVLAGVDAGGKRSPRGRRLGRMRRGQRMQAARRGELRDVRQLAGLHPPRRAASGPSRRSQGSRASAWRGSTGALDRHAAASTPAVNAIASTRAVLRIIGEPIISAGGPGAGERIAPVRFEGPGTSLLYVACGALPRHRLRAAPDRPCAV